MKVQINSLEALERLLGGDTEVEIELRGAIVQEFAKKHLKALANSDALHKVIDATRSAIIKEAQQKLDTSIASFKTDYRSGIYDLKLRPEILGEIQRKVEELVADKLSAAVRAAVEEKLSDENLSRALDLRFKYYTDELVRQKVRETLELVRRESERLLQ